MARQWTTIRKAVSSNRAHSWTIVFALLSARIEKITLLGGRSAMHKLLIAEVENASDHFL